MVPPSTLLARVPRLPPVVGTVIDRVPPVTVIDAEVSPGKAEADGAMPNVSSPTERRRRRLRVRTARTIDVLQPMTGFERCSRGFGMREPQLSHQCLHDDVEPKPHSNEGKSRGCARSDRHGVSVGGRPVDA